MRNRILNLRFLENGHPWVDGQERPVTLDEIEDAISTLKAAKMLWSPDQHHYISQEYDAYIDNNDAQYGDERGSVEEVNNMMQGYGRGLFTPARPSDTPTDTEF